jgi:hypothetical protein
LAFVQGVAWTTRAVDPDAEAAELLLECGLSRPDLFEIANFVQAHRLHVMAYRATVKSRGFVPPLTLTLSEAKALRWELATLLQGGESGVDLFGRDGLEDRLHDMDVLIESIQKVEEPF